LWECASEKRIFAEKKLLMKLKDKTILVTGAFGLIGQEVCRHFMQEGAKVAWTDVYLDQETVAWLRSNYDEAAFLVAEMDITNEAQVTEVVTKITAHFGSIDVLVNNAAIDAKFDKTGIKNVNQSRFEHYPLDTLRRSIEVNLTGTIIVTQVVCRQMLQQGHGNIINVASTYSVVAPNQSLYDFGEGVQNYKPIDYIASKSFIPNFTRYIATFYAQNNIRCNAIVPHGILNNHNEAFLTNFAKLSPLQRMANREELRGPFTLLASDESSYMTGSVLMVDGGWTAW
jgi:NAD(P)-dependent dehydrogenase (short-subunit alcohol dehydrogenase family)